MKLTDMSIYSKWHLLVSVNYEEIFEFSPEVPVSELKRVTKLRNSLRSDLSLATQVSLNSHIKVDNSFNLPPNLQTGNDRSSRSIDEVLASSIGLTDLYQFFYSSGPESHNYSNESSELKDVLSLKTLRKILRLLKGIVKLIRVSIKKTIDGIPPMYSIIYEYLDRISSRFKVCLLSFLFNLKINTYLLNHEKILFRII